MICGAFPPENVFVFARCCTRATTGLLGEVIDETGLMAHHYDGVEHFPCPRTSRRRESNLRPVPSGRPMTTASLGDRLYKTD